MTSLDVVFALDLARRGPNGFHCLREFVGAAERNVDAVSATGCVLRHPVAIRWHEVTRASVPERQPDIGNGLSLFVNDRGFEFFLFRPLRSLGVTGLGEVFWCPNSRILAGEWR
jgi:hypothetical protein